MRRCSAPERRLSGDSARQFGSDPRELKIEGAVATRLAAGPHGGLDPVRLLHWTSRCVLSALEEWRLPSPLRG
jgi:hypothetical protein